MHRSGGCRCQDQEGKGRNSEDHIAGTSQRLQAGVSAGLDARRRVEMQ